MGCMDFRRACIMSPEMIDKYPWEWPSVPHPHTLYYPTYFTPTQKLSQNNYIHTYATCGWLGLNNGGTTRLYKVACYSIVRTIYRRAKIMAISWVLHGSRRLGFWLGSYTSQNGDCTNLTKCLFCRAGAYFAHR